MSNFRNVDSKQNGNQKENINSPAINPWVTYLDFSGNYNNGDLPYDQIYNLKSN